MIVLYKYDGFFVEENMLNNTNFYYGRYVMSMQKYFFVICAVLLNHSAVADWQKNNRAISITSGLIKQDYQEYEKQSRVTNGVINTEKANIHEIALNSRFQSEKGVWLQGRISSITGATEYDGYLQNNTQLIPYVSVTDNAMLNVSANVGYALPVGKKLQIIPNISGLHQRWDRRLTQYDEYYSTQSAMAGVVAQYQATKKIGLEISADVGKNIKSHINVPSHNFQQDLAKQNIWQVGAKASYQLTDNLAVIGEINYKEIKHGESPVQNGLQYPSGKSVQTSGLAGLRVSF